MTTSTDNTGSIYNKAFAMGKAESQAWLDFIDLLRPTP